MEGQEYYHMLVKTARKKNKLPAVNKKKLDVMCRSIARLYRNYETGEANQRVQKILEKYINERRP